MVETQEFSITRASQLTIPNKDWTHYRMGLKLRCCTSISSGVNIEIVSQGRSIDSTYVTASNVKFLVKEPIVGLKIFDGDVLTKRLQLTFSSEANFNMFSSKIRQWIGVTITTESCAYSNSQDIPVRQLRQRGPPDQVAHKVSQVEPVEYSQNLTQEIFSQQDPLLLSQNLFTQAFRPEPEASASQRELPVRNETFSQPSSFHGDNSKLPNAFQFLLDVSNKEHSSVGGENSILSQSTDLFSNNTQYNTYLMPGTYPSNSEATANTTVNSNSQFTKADLTNALKAIPFEASREKRSKSRSKKRNPMDRILEKTLTHIRKEKKKTLLTMNDDELSVRVMRRLNNTAFSNLLKRVENILENP